MKILALLLIGLATNIVEAAAPPPDFAALVTKIEQNIGQAQTLAAGGKSADASALVADTYFDLFEGGGLEQAIAMRSATVKTDLENQFNGLRSSLAKHAALPQIQTRATNLVRQLKVATYQLGDDANWWDKFLSSMLIILREGFEAILVIGAITAFLIKTNNRSLLKVVRHASFVAIGLSCLLAAVFQWVFRITTAQRELVEGVTMAFACVVLFMVGHWLIAQAESQHWMKYVKQQLSGALSSQSRNALWMTCFLAVFREGAETVLFYQALWVSSSPQLHSSIAGGLLAGSLGLGFIYFTFQRGILKIPMKPFFRVTSALLYFLSITIAGKAVIEFQAGGLLRVDALDGWPSLPILGFYPTVEHLIVQGILVASLLLSLSWLGVRHRREQASAKLAAIKALKMQKVSEARP